MNDNLKNELCLYLGTLLHKENNTFDWMEKDVITKKINAVNTLLDINEHKQTWYQKVAQNLKKAIIIKCIITK
jgi:hypothetical protein